MIHCRKPDEKYILPEIIIMFCYVMFYKYYKTETEKQTETWINSIDMESSFILCKQENLL